MFQDHLLNLQKVFQQFQEARIKLNLGECQLSQKEPRFFGHIVSPEGITTDTKKLKPI
jgi:hypothetical protein